MTAISVCLIGLCNANAQTRAVEDDEQLVNWYYAAVYGTGIYSAGDRKVGILQAPLTFPLRESNEEQWGLSLNLRVSLGFYDFSFDGIDQGSLPSSISTLSVVPGIELEKRVVPRWLLRPYVSVGAGWDLGGDESAWIYDMGARSRFRLGDDRGSVFSLVNWLSLAGYRPSGGSHEPLGLFAIGIDIETPTGQTFHDRPLFVSVLPTYYYYFKKLGFAEIGDRDNTVREEGEFAISLFVKKPFKFLGFDVERIGIAVRTGVDITGYRIFTTLPF